MNTECSPLTKIPFIQRVVCFSAKEAAQAIQLKCVCSVWKETLSFYPGDLGGNFVKNVNGETELFLAVRKGDSKRVKAFASCRAIVNLSEKVHGKTPLHEEVSFFSSRLEIIQVLLEAGADISCQDRNGETAMHSAIRKGSSSVVEALAKSGQGVNFKNGNGDTPLHYVIQVWTSGRCLPLEIIDILVQSGADPGLQNVLKKTVWNMAEKDTNLYEHLQKVYNEKSTSSS